MPVKAAIYARISRQSESNQLNVDDQEAACRKLCADRGWGVADVYADRFITAADPKKKRPEFDRLLADIQAGRVDAVVVWHADRLWRQPAELEVIFKICDAAGLDKFASASGDRDLSNPDDQMFLRVGGAFAANEVAKMRTRQRDKAANKAQRGEFHGGPRPFGYGQPPVDDSAEAKRASIATYNQINDAEATLLKQAAEKILNDGGSLRSIANEWRANGVKSTRGGNITETMIQRMLIKPRIAGLVEYKGDVLGKAQWPAILDEATWESVKTVLTDPARRVTRANKNYILRSILKCGRCGGMLTPDRNRYLCSSNLGCGRLSISQRLYEHRILAMIVPMADEPELRNLIEAADAGDYEEAQALRVTIAKDRKTLQQIEDDHYIEQTLDRPAFLRLSKNIKAQIEQKEAKLLSFNSRSALGYLGGGVMSRWNKMDADDQRAIIKSMVEYIEVKPSETPGRTSIDMSRINFVWRYEGIGAVLEGMQEKGESYRLFAVWPPTQQPS